MTASRQEAVRPHLRFFLRRLLHGLTTLIIVVANLDHGMRHAFADNLGETPSRPNIVLILAEDE